MARGTLPWGESHRVGIFFQGHVAQMGERRPEKAQATDSIAVVATMRRVPGLVTDHVSPI
jgi:hypothetical protein